MKRAYWALGAGGSFIVLLYFLAPILTPFVAGALVAYLADPLVDRLENHGLGRQAAVILVFGVLVLLVGAILGLGIPVLEDQIANLIDNLPSYGRWLQTKVVPWLEGRFGIRIRFLKMDQIAGALSGHWQQAGGVASTVLAYLSQSGMALVAVLANVVLIPVVIFYLLRDWDLLTARLFELVPRPVAPTVRLLALEADEVLSAFFRGQFTVMLALGGIYSIGLALVGIKLSLLIGMFAGLVSFIPYAGAISGFCAASIAAMAQFGETSAVLWVLLVFGVGQTLEGVVLTPWLVGNKIGLHPVAVIFAVLAGGQLFGFLGVLLALPLASVIMVLLRHAHAAYLESELYGDCGPEVAKPTDESSPIGPDLDDQPDQEG